MANERESSGKKGFTKKMVGMEDEQGPELTQLREIAKRAGVRYGHFYKYEKNSKLLHVVNACLHIAQATVACSIEIFHWVHHYTNRLRQENDDTVPSLPEERNPIFILYPACMLMSGVFAILWLVKKMNEQIIKFALAGCAICAFLLLFCGIMEMKHVDKYIDLVQVSDEDLIQHPVFIHNFVMCILSIIGMTLYLLQMWLLYDYWRWLTVERKVGVSEIAEDSEYDMQSDSPRYADKDESIATDMKHKERRADDELEPIPSLDEYAAPASQKDVMNVEDEPVVFYCCCVDWYNYVKFKWYSGEHAGHEFQVVHVM